MRLTLADYVDPDIDPADPFEPQAMVGDAFLHNAIFDPALLASQAAIPPDVLERQLTTKIARDVLRQQQYITFDMGKSIGILQPFVPKTRDALQYVDLVVERMTTKSLRNSMLATGIGAAADVLSAIPNIYAQIAALVLDFSLSLVSWLQQLVGIDQPVATPVREMLPMQQYSSGTDKDLFNFDIRGTLDLYDWSRVFMPRYRGTLTGQTAKNGSQQRSIGWSLGDGVVPQVIYPLGSGKEKWKHWDFTDGQPIPSGGLGMIPGGERIYAIVQTTAASEPVGPSKGMPYIYNPNCGGIEGATRIDIGSYYPTTTQGAMTLWNYCFQVGAAMYTVDAIGLATGRNDGSGDYEIYGWQKYLNEIWEGVVRLWRNPAYEGRWGCSFWKAALQTLVQNYTVSPYGVGVLSWTPTTNDKLSLADQDAWENNNVFTKLIQPALWKLSAAQLQYLGKTNMAAYLPIYGGVEAEPLNQDRVMGSMREYVVRRAFYQARRRILDGPSKDVVVLDDVLDPVFRKQIKDAGGGKGTKKDVQTLQLNLPDGIAFPWGGGGLGFAAPEGGQKRTWPYMVAAGGVMASTALTYFFWDDLSRLLQKARRRLPRRRS